MPTSRRAFVHGLAAIPILGLRNSAYGAEQASAAAAQSAPGTAASADKVLNIMEFEPLARAALPPAHFGYIATGADDDRTVVRNHEAFSHYEIRTRHLTDLRHMDLTRTVFGERWSSPIYLSAVSSMGAFHPEKEIAVARAAKARSTKMMLSSGTSASLAEVSSALGASPWQQLYPTDDWNVAAGIVRRAEEAGCRAIVLTVDLHGARNNETLIRAMREDTRNCQACHVGNSHDMWRRGPIFKGLDVSRVTDLTPLDMSPTYLDRLRKEVKGKLLVKGLATAEDAALAVEHGADGIIVSNHGGRNEESLHASIDCVPEVVAAVKGRIPVFVDGGIRRGTDIFKALALGATAVGIGRPQVWGLAAFGQPGVEAVLDIFNRELATIMRQAGTPALADITAKSVVRA